MGEGQDDRRGGQDSIRVEGGVLPALGDGASAQKDGGTAQGFGVLIESLEELKEAAATRASEEALKLRKEKQCVKELTIWIQTNPFGHDPQFGDARTVVFPVATNDTSTLIRYVVAVVEAFTGRAIATRG